MFYLLMVIEWIMAVILLKIWWETKILILAACAVIVMFAAIISGIIVGSFKNTVENKEEEK